MKAETYRLIKILAEALEDAELHLDYCGYGDSWEREAALAQELPEKIEGALKAYKNWNGYEK